MLPPLPDIPAAKIYGELTTPEQDVIYKLVHEQPITRVDEAILIEAIEFYRTAFQTLKSVDLSKIDEEDLSVLKEFMRVVFNLEIVIQNKIYFEDVFRLSFVREAFLEKNKVRDLKYLVHPPLEIIKQQGVYGRANSSASTLFYCASHPAVAFLETKLDVGDRVILGHWKHDVTEPFVTYPITNNKTIPNQWLTKATLKFQERMRHNHPLFAEILDLTLEFISSEFVKDSEVKHPLKYEYLFSSYFAEAILDNSFKPVDHPVEPLNHYDALVYPSIAAHYATENLAVVPGSVKKLTPYLFLDAIVSEHKSSVLNGEEIPVTLQVLRKSYFIDGNLIVWDDD